MPARLIDGELAGRWNAPAEILPLPPPPPRGAPPPTVELEVVDGTRSEEPRKLAEGETANRPPEVDAEVEVDSANLGRVGVVS